MAMDLSQVLVVDVEATCWSGAPPEGQEPEIIEIGWCVLETPGRTIVRSGDILVRPQRSSVSAFCTELTTLTQETVDDGIGFADACGLLRDDVGAGQMMWASYGDYDRRQFRRQCSGWSVDYPFADSHLNIKVLFALMRGEPHAPGMAGALRALGLPLQGTHHRACDDAANIASILGALLLRGRG